MGFKGLVSTVRERREHPDSLPERNLAVAILRQAWNEAIIDLCAIKETTQKDYSILKQNAIEWIRSDDSGFLYWCQLADVDHIQVRLKLSNALDLQHHAEPLAQL